ncbi:MAG: hypothetical protein OXU27_18505 [Candidatus Poribacteria bacterium]|nr:hypothetical protein [Candidatus Poribacteria bacterium]
MSLPTIDKDAPIFTPAFEYQESTLQLPFGEFSIFSDLKANRVSPIEAIVTLTLCYRSNWSTGLTWRTSIHKLSDLLHISDRYVRDALGKATDWIQRKTAPKGNVAGTFEITHHKCHPLLVPMDKDNRPLSFAVPRGAGGIFERLFAGDIDWKAALVWLMLKLHSDWRTGVTNKINMKTLAKWTGFGKKTVCDAIKMLGKARMLQRLSEKWECSQFQLYPKPYKNRAARRRDERQQEKSKWREMRFDGEWRYSFNELYRLNVLTSEIQTRAVKTCDQWQSVKDRERHRIPKAIRKAFEGDAEPTPHLRL